ncbi:MAG: hypothetical protein IPM39_10640 [Chloroflexi bacterium]|nr:hypothetical protein [Chloroflexota bacterium]
MTAASHPPLLLSKPAVPTQHRFISQNLQQPVAFHVYHFCFTGRPFPIAKR